MKLRTVAKNECLNAAQPYNWAVTFHQVSKYIMYIVTYILHKDNYPLSTIPQ